MTHIANSITELIGHTPLLRASNIEKAEHLFARLLLKLEYFNPLSSVKDRAAYYMILDAKERGILKAGSVIVEPTSGNTGVGLAFISSVSGYRLILTMPETMSSERKSLLRALGAELVLTDGSKGMSGAIEKAKEIVANTPGAYMPMQFENSANARAHEETTAQEIWLDTDGEVDFFVAGVGSGGTITGTGRGLKAHDKSIGIIAAEPAKSAVLSGKKAGPHGIQGIGAGFVPKVLDMSVVDEVIAVTDEDSYKYSRMLSKKEGVLCGISAGAALAAGIEVAKRVENTGKTVVVLIPDTGERYLSTPLFAE